MIGVSWLVQSLKANKVTELSCHC